MGGYYDYRPYFQDIESELSSLRTEIKDINEQWLERNTEQHEVICDKLTILGAILVLATVTTVMFK